MPPQDIQEGRRNGRLLTVVFWTGVGLAPLGALLVVVSSGTGALKVAAVLAILAVVLVGLSIMLRPDATTVKAELEETILDEVGRVRAAVREDIAHASRSTHNAFSDKLHALYDNLESIRGQVEVVRGQVEAVRTYSQERPDDRPAPSVSRSAPVPVQSSAMGSAIVGGGVVRHTETVRETTRHTIVDPHAESGSGGTVYGGGTGFAPPAAEPEKAGGRQARESGWSDHETGRDTRDRHARDRDGRDARDRDGRDARDRDGRDRESGRERESARAGRDWSSREPDTDGGRGTERGRDADRGWESSRGWEAERGWESSRGWEAERGWDSGRSRHSDRGRDSDPLERTGDRSERGGDRSELGERSDRSSDRSERSADRGRGSDAPREESWTEQRLRARFEESRALASSIEPDSDGLRIPAQRSADFLGTGPSGGSQDTDEPHWSGLRAAGDRWAAVRADDRGRELRMGERRAEVRSDESGSELRIEDRWATVRREDDRRSSGSDRAETRRERREREEARSAESRSADSRSGSRSTGRRAATDDDESPWVEPVRERPALPAGGVPAPSWATAWSDESPAHREREREPVDRERHGERESRAARRRRDDDDDRWEREPTDPGRARPRRLDFELTDDRWH